MVNFLWVDISALQEHLPLDQLMDILKNDDIDISQFDAFKNT